MFFAIIIKLLELFEGDLVNIVNVIKRPPSSQNIKDCCCSGTDSPYFYVSSIVKKLPEYFCGGSKEEKPQNFNLVIAEGNELCFEKANVHVIDALDVNDVVVSEVMYDDVVLSKIKDHNVPLSFDKVSPSSPVVGDADNVYSGIRKEHGCNATSFNDSFVDRSSGFGGESKLETFNSICFPFVAATSSLTVSIEGHSFHCVLDSGAAVTAISAKVWQDCLRHAYPNLDRPSLESVTSVNGCRFVYFGKNIV